MRKTISTIYPYTMRYTVVLLIICLLSLNVSAQVKYSLTYTDSASQKIRISIQLAKEQTAPVNFIMPRSIPGAYSMLMYDHFVENIYAVNGKGEKFAMKKDENDAPRWYYADTGK